MSYVYIYIHVRSANLYAHRVHTYSTCGGEFFLHAVPGEIALLKDLIHTCMFTHTHAYICVADPFS
jgi:hypothetical protein